MRIISLLFILCLSLAANAQSPDKPVEIGNPKFDDYFLHHSPPVIHGRIFNATKQELDGLDVSYALVTLTPEFQQPSKSIKINNDGTFILKLDHALPYQQIWFSMGNYFYTCLYANNDLTLELDIDKLKKKNVSYIGDGVKFKGKDAQVNEFMNEALLYEREKQDDITGKLNSLQKVKDDIYMQRLDSLTAEQKKINDAFIRSHPSNYAWVLNNELTSDYYTRVLHHAMWTSTKPPQWEQIRAHKIYLVSNTSSIFIETLYNYCTYFKLQKEFIAKDYAKQTHGLDRLLGSSHANVFKLKMNSKDVAENETILTYLTSSVRSPWCKAILVQEHKESIARVRNVNNILNQATTLNPDSTIGKPIASFAFGAKLSTVSDMDPGEFIKQLKALYKGNTLVIDIWATWCVPCQNEMPYSLKLSNQATNLPVKFIYLCTSEGSNIDLWRNKIADMKQTGTHIFVDQKLMQKLMALFDKGGFPSYILINSSGQLAKENIQFMSMVSIDDVKKWTEEK